MQGRPLPEPSPLTAGFWEAAADGRLVLQRCDACGRHRHYPQHRCPHCREAAWRWAAANGRGRIHSFTVTHHAFHPAWTGRTPYVVATVQLDEGVRVVTDMDEDPAIVRIDAPVEVFFEDTGGGRALPRFRIAGRPASAPADRDGRPAARRGAADTHTTTEGNT
ncbi:Zn-ribbon domain-containing OB-fold protein [Tomitella gaofuii]|uniref:Zn-ribbon domain-containing OB-fold protein n=1 Tax=Tomitella gaofuii TaxID=2760083 RepID=UPI0015FCAB48|nr:OB-fold domain-containing protein [Tomitella gaofuii]